LYRFLARADFEEVHGWMNGELLMGTPAADRIAIIGTICGKLIAVSALSVKDPGRHRAINDMMEMAKTFAAAEIARLQENARLRLIKG
jgi:hypothetical protein